MSWLARIPMDSGRQRHCGPQRPVTWHTASATVQKSKENGSENPKRKLPVHRLKANDDQGYGVHTYLVRVRKP